MTKQEFLQKKRFKAHQHQYPITTELTENLIFEVITLHNTVVYLRIVRALYGIFFDLEECEASGQKLRFAQKRNSVKYSEIIALIATNDWRIFKTNRL